MVMQACTPLDEEQRIPACSRRALLLHAEGEQSVRAVLDVSTPSRRWASRPLPFRPRTGARSPTGSLRACRCPNTPPSGTPPGSSEGAAMTAVSTTGTAPRPRLRLRARIVLAGLSACGLAALAWASFVHPLPRLTYNPSDSVAVGWYRVDPLDHRAARCHVGYPWAPSCWFRCRPRLPRCAARLPADTHSPAQASGRSGAARGVHRRRQRSHRRRAFGRRAVCGSLGPAAAILAAVPPPSARRAVPAQRHQSGVVRQPLLGRSAQLP